MNEIIIKDNKNEQLNNIIIDDVNKRWIKCTENRKSDGTIEKKYKVLPMELAQYIKENVYYIFAKNGAADEAMTYFYTGGKYKWIKDDEFKGFIKEFIPYQLRKSRDINEILYDLKTENRFVDINLLNSDETIINFEDGIYNVIDEKLYPHDPKYLSTIQIPVKYADVKAAKPMEAVNFLNYMKTLCSNDNDVIKLLWECMALCVSNIYGYRTKKALFLIGKGDSGKSQIKKLIENLVGTENFSAVDLKQLNDRFGTSLIYQKRLSGSNDMQFQTVDDMSIFKQLTGGDTIVMEFKNMQSFSYTYRGFLWFNCNRMPKFGGDTGKWVYERIIPVYCNNVIPKEKQDKFLFDKMWKERAAIIKILLIQLSIFIKNEYKLTEPECLKINREEYEIENNTFLSFIKECCYYRPNGVMTSMRIRRSEFRKAYKNYVIQNYKGKYEISWADAKEMLKDKFGEEFVKTDGIWYLEKINIKEEEDSELFVER